MVVITLEKCPASLRGDLTKWLQEISLGVYVGQISARVRDNLWERVCSEAKSGRATMVYSAQNEQHLDFRVHNTSWEPVDFDGLKLMLRPNSATVGKASGVIEGFSNASKLSKIGNSQKARHNRAVRDYVVVDLETTGLASQKDEIIEITALKVANGIECDRFQTLVKTQGSLPDSIMSLTGLSNDDISRGTQLEEAIDDFLLFVGSLPVVMHNAAFDMAFIDAALERLNIDELDNDCIDTLELAKKKLPSVASYTLADLALMMEIDVVDQHRALGDCLMTKELFEKLLML